MPDEYRRPQSNATKFHWKGKRRLKMFISASKSQLDWEGFIIICPAVSVGNVGQLTVDLIISSLDLQRVGYLNSRCLLPLCGNDAFSSTSVTQGSLTTAAEVFESKERRLVVLQQRAPIVKGRQAEFRKELRRWIHSCKFSKVILLTSSSAHERIDSQLTGSYFRFLTTPTLNSALQKSLSEQFQWTELEKRNDTWSRAMGRDIVQERYFVPGGGIAEKFFKECSDDGIALAILLVFCSEGDNIPDAFNLISHLNQWLKLKDQPPDSKGPSWKVPLSWSLLFGRRVDTSIF